MSLSDLTWAGYAQYLFVFFCPADYFTQVQGQMWIAERSQCDLYLYHPDLPSGLITVARDDAFIKTLAEQVTNLIAKRDEFVQVLESWS